MVYLIIGILLLLLYVFATPQSIKGTVNIVILVFVVVALLILLMLSILQIFQFTMNTKTKASQAQMRLREHTLTIINKSGIYTSQILPVNQVSSPARQVMKLSQSSVWKKQYSIRMVHGSTAI